MILYAFNLRLNMLSIIRFIIFFVSLMQLIESNQNKIYLKNNLPVMVFNLLSFHIKK